MLCDKKCGGLCSIVKGIESKFGVKVDNYTFKKVDFMDGSLDLPEQGKFYTMAIVPGYKILADIAGDGKKLFHTPLNGKPIKENPDPNDY